MCCWQLLSPPVELSGACTLQVWMDGRLHSDDSLLMKHFSSACSDASMGKYSLSDTASQVRWKAQKGRYGVSIFEFSISNAC